MRHRTPPSIVLVIVVASLCACGGKEEQARPADTQAAPQQAEALPPPPASSKIGKLSLLTTPFPGDSCIVNDIPAAAQGRSGIVKNAIYQGSSPTRTIRLAIGDTSRAFRPISLDITGRQPGSSGADDIETLWVVFNPNGDIRGGTRQYNTADNSAVEKSGLLDSDSAAVKQLATTLIDVCRVRL